VHLEGSISFFTEKGQSRETKSEAMETTQVRKNNHVDASRMLADTASVFSWMLRERCFESLEEISDAETVSATVTPTAIPVINPKPTRKGVN
jgi:hypothetical protein